MPPPPETIKRLLTRHIARQRQRHLAIAGGAALTALLLATLATLLLISRERPGSTAGRIARHASAIAAHAERTGLPAALIRAVIYAESRGRAGAHSDRDARGLMQVRTDAETDALARLDRTSRGDLFDPEYNLLIGTSYLAMLWDRFDRDPRLAVAAYHMGPTRLARLRDAHPQLGSAALIARHAGPATRAYVKQVMARFEAAP